MLKLLTIEIGLIVLYILIRRANFNIRFSVRHVFKEKLYEFFVLRDNLIWLVAEGEIDENDELFQIIYKRLSYCLHYFEKVHRLHLKTIEEIMDKLTEEDILEIRNLVEKIEQHPSNELKEIIKSFDNKLIKIIFTNSIFYITIKYVIPALKKYIPQKIKRLKPITKIRDLNNNINYINQEASALA